MAIQVLFQASAKDLAHVRREAKALRAAVADTQDNATVEVSSVALRALLEFIDSISVEGDAKSRLAPTKSARTVRQAGSAEAISPQEAADILRMSRPSVMRLIDKGVLHSRKIHSRNKLSRAEVLEYQRAQTKTQRDALENLARLSEQYDF